MPRPWVMVSGGTLAAAADLGAAFPPRVEFRVQESELDLWIGSVVEAEGGRSPGLPLFLGAHAASSSLANCSARMRPQ